MAAPDEKTALAASLDALRAQLPGSFTERQLIDFINLHGCRHLVVLVEGSQWPLPCPFPGCPRGTAEHEVLAGGRLRLRRALRWFGGPQFEWQYK